MSSAIVDKNDNLIPKAAPHAERFLRTIQERADAEGIGVKLKAGRRGLFDSTPVLKATVKAGYQNDVKLEVFAEAQGSGLHVGWHASHPELGGALAGVGMFGQSNALNRAIGGTANKQRKLAGILQAFDQLVYRPVLQDLVMALRNGKGSQASGFLGA